MRLDYCDRTVNELNEQSDGAGALRLAALEPPSASAAAELKLNTVENMLLATALVQNDRLDSRLENGGKGADARPAVDKFCRFFEENWNSLVPNGRDRIYPNELHAALKSNRYTEEQKGYMLAAEEMSTALGAMTLSVRSGFLKESVEKLHKWQAGVEQHRAMIGPATKYGIENFDRLDTSKNGFISQDELKSALAKANPQHKANVQFLLDNISDFRKAGHDQWFWQSKGISPAGLAGYGVYYKDNFYNRKISDYEWAINPSTAPMPKEVARCEEDFDREMKYKSKLSEPEKEAVKTLFHAVIEGNYGAFSAAVTAYGSNPQALKSLIDRFGRYPEVGSANVRVIEENGDIGLRVYCGSSEVKVFASGRNTAAAVYNDPAADARYAFKCLSKNAREQHSHSLPPPPP
jgi:hypothetical protein